MTSEEGSSPRVSLSSEGQPVADAFHAVRSVVHALQVVKDMPGHLTS